MRIGYDASEGPDMTTDAAPAATRSAVPGLAIAFATLILGLLLGNLHRGRS